MHFFTRWLWLGLMLFPLWGYSQAYQVGFVSGQGNPGGVTDADNSTTDWEEAFEGPASANVYSDTIAIPFAFEFFGTSVDYLKASPNGVLTFDTATTVLPDSDAALPTTDLPNQSIAVFWDDFDTPNSGDDILWKVFGQAPNRQLWVKWFSMDVGTASFAYFAAVLEEGTNNIYLVDLWESGATGPARVGLQNNTTEFVVGSNNTSLVGSSADISNNSYWVFSPPVTGIDTRVTGVSLSDLAANGCGSANEAVTIQITNGGNQSASGLVGTFAVNGALPTFVENIPGTLNPGDTLAYTFTQSSADLSAPGNYDITGIVTAAGDVANTNDSLTTTIATEAALAFPLPIVDFSGYSGSNLPTVAPGWFEAEGLAMPDSGSSSWFEDDFLNDVNHPNGSSVRIQLSSDTDEEWIIGPKVAPGPTSLLSFDLGLTASFSGSASNFGSDDYLEVLVSTDCGATFTPLVRYDSTSNVSNLGQTEVIQLGAYAGQDIIIGFFATEGTFDDDESCNVYIDNIHLNNPTPVEVAATEVSLLSTSFCLGAGETIEGTLQNTNLSLLDFAVNPVDWTLEIAGPVPGTFSGTINTGTLEVDSTLTLTLTTAADFSLSGSYDLNFTLSNPDDNLAGNDTAMATILVANQTAPYFEDFSSFSPATTYGPGWTIAGNPDYIWEVDNNSTTSGSTGPGQDNTTGTGNYVFTEASFPAATGDSALLISPCIDLGTLTAPGMSFWYHMYGEDMGTLEVWVFTETDSSQVFSISGEQDVDEAPADPWNNALVDLSAFAGQTIKVALLGIRGPDFGSDMAVDDISIFQLTGVDMAATDLMLPESDCYFLMDSSITYEVTNFADSLDLSNDTIFVTLDIDGPMGPATLLDTLTGGGLDTMATLTGTFTYAFNSEGTYTFDLLVAIDDDQNAGNNALTNVQGVALPLYVAPYTEDFDAFTPSTGDSDPSTLSVDWRRNRTEPLAWYPNENATPSSGTGPDDDNGGGGVYMYTEASIPAATGDTATLTTTCIDLSGLAIPALEFFYHMHGEEMGTLEVSVSNLQGMTMTLWSLSGEQQTDESDPYLRALVDLTPFAGDTVEITFVSIRGTSFEGDMAIDNVSVIEPSGTEVAMEEVATLGGPGCLAPQDSLAIVFDNLGAALDFATDTVFINVTVNGPAGVQAVADTISSGNLAVFDSFSYTIDGLFDFAQVGTYDVEVALTLAGDTDALDDTLNIALFQLQTVSLPVGPLDFTGYNSFNLNALFPDWFEGEGDVRPDTTSDSDWTDDDWINDTNHPNGVSAKINLFSNTKTGEWLVGPRIIPDSLTVLTYDLALTQWDNTTAGNLGSDDQFMVMVSTDCGNSYVPVQTFDASSTISNTGQTEYVDLSSYEGQDILVAFFATEGTVNDPEDVDLFVDNVNIAEGDSINNVVVSLLSPMDNACGDSMTMGEVLIANLGVNDLVNPTVAIEVVGPMMDTTTFAATYNGTLALGESDTVGFGPFDTYNGGFYDITVLLSDANDQDPTNDTLETTLFFQSVAAPGLMAFDDVCLGDSLMLMADDTLYADTDFAWYADDTLTQLATGVSFNTGPINDTTTFFLGRISTGPEGCSSELTEIVVEPLPLTEAGFTVDSTGNLFASFADGSLNADSVKYFFGDGDSSSMASPMYMYADTGTYTVQQVAYGFCGNDTAEQEVIITCVAPMADFNATVVADSNGVTVEFVSILTGVVDSIKYDFGNGVTAEADTTLDFELTGQYTVTLVAYNICGNDTATQTLDLQNTGLGGALAAQSLSLYPNPTDGAFTVDLELTQQAELRIELLDARGRVLMSEDLGSRFGQVSHRLEAEDLAEGLYLVKIVADEQVIVRKLRVE